MYFSNLATYKGLKRSEGRNGEKRDEEIQEKEKMLEFLLCVVSVWCVPFMRYRKKEFFTRWASGQSCQGGPCPEIHGNLCALTIC
jgi:hypothetical protein